MFRVGVSLIKKKNHTYTMQEEEYYGFKPMPNTQLTYDLKLQCLILNSHMIFI
jgi:hypothetical protein